MSWLNDVEDKRNQKDKQEKELQKRLKAEAQPLDAMVRRLLNDVGMVKWGQFFSWSFPPGYIKRYEVVSGGWTLRRCRHTGATDG